MKTRSFFTLLISCSGLLLSCNKDVKNYSDIHFFLQFAPDQERLNNAGDSAILAPGRAEQTPVMQVMAINYIELSEDSTTQYKQGARLYLTPQLFVDGQQSTDFDSLIITDQNVDFMLVNFERLPPGTYRYARVSVDYQNFNVTYNLHNIQGVADQTSLTGRVASFLGYSTFVRHLSINEMDTTFNATKAQGYWALESILPEPLTGANHIYTGQSPQGTTTAVNIIDATSPIAAGSSVVTGAFSEPLEITGNETGGLNIYFSFSTNGSFEWIDNNGNGEWDVDATDSTQTEKVMDMGLRGLVPTWEWKE